MPDDQQDIDQNQKTPNSPNINGNVSFPDGTSLDDQNNSDYPEVVLPEPSEVVIEAEEKTTSQMPENDANLSPKPEVGGQMDASVTSATVPPADTGIINDIKPIGQINSVSDDQQDFGQNIETETQQPVNQEATPIVAAPMVAAQPDLSTIGGEAGKKPWWQTKKFIIGAIVSVVVLLIVGGSAFAYTSYQDPKKVLADSVINAFIAKKATYTGKIEYNYSNKSEYSGEENKVKATVEFNSKFSDQGQQGNNAKLTLEYNKKTYSLEGDALFDKEGDIYWRVQGLKALATEAKNTLGINNEPTISAAIDKFINRIDGTWVRISTKDLQEIDEDYSKTKECVDKAVDEFKNDKAAILEVANLYRMHPYIVIEEDLGINGSNFVYEVGTDIAAGQKFLLALRDTKIYKSLNDCDDSFVIEKEDVDRMDDESDYKDPNIKEESTYKLSINMWSHKIAKFEGDYKMTDTGYGNTTTSSSALVTPNYDQEVSVTAPSESISLTTFKSYVDELMESVTNSY